MPESALRQLVKNRKFWITTAVVSSASLIFYDWYNDRYATPATRYERIENDYIISVKKLRTIRKEFIREMERGLKEPDLRPHKDKVSCLKMLCSHVRSIPNGTEKGVYYALDWGGSNYRVLRIEFSGKKGSKPIHTEFKTAIDAKYQKTDSSEELFDYLAQGLATKFAEDQVDPKIQYPVGFTFSFPMAQPALDTGILVEWTKGFDIPDVVGQDVVYLMQSAFDRQNINAKIHAVCNDTVGTLLSSAYEYDNVRVGLILGTGSNGCYIEPDEKSDADDGEIINIEWGGFGEHIEFPRMPTDFIMDEATPNPGHQFAEKMISGHYLGELVRLVSIEVFREQITDYGENTPLNFRWQFKSETVSRILTDYYKQNLAGIVGILGTKYGLTQFTNSDANIFGRICRLIVNRSADLAATLLLGTLEKTGVYTCSREDERNPFEEDRFELTQSYKQNTNKLATVGIDGSVYQHVPRYKERMEYTILNVVGREVAQRIQLVHAHDGSGKGAALAVAAVLK
eukprot:7265_1